VKRALACLSFALCAWCTGAVLESAHAPLHAQAVAPVQSPRPDRRIDLDFSHTYGAAELEQALLELAAAYPEFVRTFDYGRSRDGRRLIALALAADCASLEDELARPALFLGDAAQGGDLRGGEALVFALYSLLQNHAREASIGELLRTRVLYFAPLLDPDQRARLCGEASSGPVDAELARFELNFPIGWRPASPSEPSGAHPLSEAHTAALADLLAARPNIALALAFENGARARRASDELEDAARRDVAWLAPIAADAQRGALALEDAELDLRRAGLLAHLGELHGAYALRARWTEREPGQDGLLDLARAVTRLAQALPVLALEEPNVQPMGDGLWRVELVAVNRGELPSASERARERRLAPEAVLDVRGARLVSAAVRAPESASYHVLRSTSSELALAPLAPGEPRALRLVLAPAAPEAPPASAVEFGLRAARAGRASLSLASGALDER
jgi:hypothetical protein